MVSQIVEPGSRQDAVNYFLRIRQYLNGNNATSELWRHLSSSERERLGGTVSTATKKYGSAILMWVHLHNVHPNEAVLGLAEEIEYMSTKKVNWIRREFGELPLDPELAQYEAIERGDLVIVRDSWSVSWKGKRIKAEWSRHRVLWDFLLISCESALKNQPVDRLSFGDNAHEKIVSNRKNRLGKIIPSFPAELLDAFQCVGRGTQKFTVPPEQIHIFDN